MIKPELKTQLQKEFAEGIHAVVHEGVHPILGTVAVKIFRRDPTEAEERWASRIRYVQHEGRLLHIARHDTVIPVYHIYDEPDHVALVLEFCRDGDVGKLCKDNPVPLPIVREILHDASLGLQYVHDLGMIHRDIKPANILKSNKGRYYLGDFGHVTANIEHGFARGTAYYRHLAPECWDPPRTSRLSDIWAVGLTAYRLINSDYAWNLICGYEPSKTPDLFGRLPFLPHVPDEWVRFVGRCMKDDPTQRYQSAGDLCTALTNLPIANWKCKREAGKITWERRVKDRVFWVEWDVRVSTNTTWVAENRPAAPGGQKRNVGMGSGGGKYQEARSQLVAFFASEAANR